VAAFNTLPPNFGYLPDDDDPFNVPVPYRRLAAPNLGTPTGPSPDAQPVPGATGPSSIPPAYIPGINAPDEDPTAQSPDAGYQSAMARLQTVYGDRPQLNKPKWWQNLAAAAAGGLAGWSNASGRRHPPIDIASMQGAIQHPGYQAAMQRWQTNELEPAQAQAEIEAGKQGAWWKSQQLQAQAQYMKAHADYMEGLGRGGDVLVTPELEQETGGIFKAGTKIPQSTATELARIAAGKYEKPERTLTVTDPVLAKHIGVAPGTDVPISIYQQAMKPAASRNLNPADVMLHPQDFDPATVNTAREMFDREHREPRDPNAPRSTPAQFKAANDKKNAALLEIEGQARKRLAQLGPEATEADKQAVWDDLATQKQTIQNNFESDVSILGGDPSHYQYGSAPPKPTGGGATGGGKTGKPRKGLGDIFRQHGG